MNPRPPTSTLFPYTTLFRSVETSLGYFINPLVSVLLGVAFFAERLRPMQWTAVAVATVAVVVLTEEGDRKSTRLNSSHANISYAVFCLKKKKKKNKKHRRID